MSERHHTETSTSNSRDSENHQLQEFAISTPGERLDSAELDQVTATGEQTRNASRTQVARQSLQWILNFDFTLRFSSRNNKRRTPLEPEETWELPWLDIVHLAQIHQGPLVLDHNKLTHLPALIGKMTKVTELHVQHNQIESIPEELGKLTKLRKLELNDNSLMRLPNSIKKLRSLERLNIGNNQLEYLVLEISKLRKLEEFYVYNNRISFLPADFCRLQNLTILSLVGNRLQSLPEDIGELRKLVQIYLTNNNLEELPDSICELKELIVLQVGLNQICEIPANIGNLDRLSHVSFAGNRLLTVPPSCVRWTKLVSFELQRNVINTLPPKIFSSFGRLTKLMLQDNCLNCLASDIGGLTHLLELDIRNNELVSLPEEIGKLHNLKNLRMSGNKLQSIPDSIRKLHKLEKLSLERNQLNVLIKKFGKRFPWLLKLDLSHNQLTNLPERFYNLVRLTHLVLDHNNLTELTPDIVLLPALQFLSLQANQLKTIPPDIGKLKELRVLKLSFNQLTELPYAIGNLLKLEELYLRGNAGLYKLPSTLSKLASLKTFDFGLWRNVDIVYEPMKIRQKVKSVMTVEERVLESLVALATERLRTIQQALVATEQSLESSSRVPMPSIDSIHRERNSFYTRLRMYTTLVGRLTRIKTAQGSDNTIVQENQQRFEIGALIRSLMGYGVQDPDESNESLIETRDRGQSSRGDTSRETDNEIERHWTTRAADTVRSRFRKAKALATKFTRDDDDDNGREDDNLWQSESDTTPSKSGISHSPSKEPSHRLKSSPNDWGLTSSTPQLRRHQSWSGERHLSRAQDEGQENRRRSLLPKFLSSSKLVMDEQSTDFSPSSLRGQRARISASHLLSGASRRTQSAPNAVLKNGHANLSDGSIDISPQPKSQSPPSSSQITEFTIAPSSPIQTAATPLKPELPSADYVENKPEPDAYVTQSFSDQLESSPSPLLLPVESKPKTKPKKIVKKKVVLTTSPEKTFLLTNDVNEDSFSPSPPPKLRSSKRQTGENVFKGTGSVSDMTPKNSPSDSTTNPSEKTVKFDDDVPSPRRIRARTTRTDGSATTSTKLTKQNRRISMQSLIPKTADETFCDDADADALSASSTDYLSTSATKPVRKSRERTSKAVLA